MTNEQALVRSWMQKFGQETPDKPTIPSLEVRKLRAKLILEEALEAIDALGLTTRQGGDSEVIILNINSIQFLEYKDLNLSLLADALADLHYVAYCGTAVACGIDMEEIFLEVHRSNMSKLWTNDEVKKELDFNPHDMDILDIFVRKDGVKAKKISNGERPWLVKNKDGKVLKSPSYSPANIKI